MPRDYDPKTIELAVNTIKVLAIDGVEKANSGHPGAPMGLANIAFEVWSRYLRHDPKDPRWLGRDRFVLSCGHASMLVYSLLHLSGYDLTMEDLKSFRQWGSRTPGHPEAHLTPGVEATTGPLGQGVGNAVGMALAAKLQEARFGEVMQGVRIFTLASDGDMMEGVSGEASSLAAHLGLSNLIVIYDDNKITLDGDAKMSFSEDVGKRYEAYGWFVQGPIDGHDHKQIRAAIDRALQEKDRPSFIVARTHIGNGAPNKHDTSKAHGEPLGKEELAATKKNLGWDPERFFYVPAEISALWKERAGELAKEHTAWDQKLDAWKKANPELGKQFDAFQKKTVPADLYAQLLKSLPEGDDATRSISATIEQSVAKMVPSLIGGSADLQTSNKTNIKNGGEIAKGEFGGRNLHFGVREHGMGAICNGMALFGGIIPFGATFLVFSDYMRGALRLSALSHLQCLWIYTHDSVLLGEDGPTHQPVEHYWALRVIPNMYFVRPADAMETAAAWAIALGRDDGPTAFALTRQKLPGFKRDAGFDPPCVLKGLYIAQEATGGKPDVILVASGSEVHLAVGARERLEKTGRKVRVVSALCLEAWGKQDAAYHEAVLPKGVRKVSIESGRTEPWSNIVGESGLKIGLDHFGASAPDKVLSKEFGLTVDAVVAKVESWL